MVREPLATLVADGCGALAHRSKPAGEKPSRYRLAPSGCHWGGRWRQIVDSIRCRAFQDITTQRALLIRLSGAWRRLVLSSTQRA